MWGWALSIEGAEWSLQEKKGFSSSKCVAFLFFPFSWCTVDWRCGDIRDILRTYKYNLKLPKHSPSVTMQFQPRPDEVLLPSQCDTRCSRAYTCSGLPAPSASHPPAHLAPEGSSCLRRNVDPGNPMNSAQNTRCCSHTFSKTWSLSWEEGLPSIFVLIISLSPGEPFEVLISFF